MSWEQEQARLAALLEEIISDNEDNVAVEIDQESDHDSLSEQEILSESEVKEAETEDRQRDDYIGKDKVTKWHKVKGRTAIRTRAHNKITEAPGPKEITSCTNIYIEKISHKYARQRDCNKTDEIEVKALIGLLMLSGLCKSSHRKLKDLWDGIFFHMLDTSGINAYVIYNWNMVQSQCNMKSPEFLESLGLSMLQGHLDRRSSQPGLPKALKRMWVFINRSEYFD